MSNATYNTGGALDGLGLRIWNRYKPFVAGFYWFKRPIGSPRTTLVRIWHDGDQWQQNDLDTGEYCTLSEAEGEYSERLVAPL